MSAHAATSPAEANAGQPGAPSEPNHPEPQQGSAEPQSKHNHHGILWVVIALVVVAVALLVGWLPRHKRDKEVNARAQAQRNAVPRLLRRQRRYSKAVTVC